MKFTFVRQHKSINSFPLTEIEAGFIVITGINGAGKTHLLEAIENGGLKVENIPRGATNIRRFHHTDMQPNDTGVAKPSELWAQRIGLWDEIQQPIFDHQQVIRERLTNNGIASDKTEDFGRVAEWTEQEIYEIVSDRGRASKIYKELQSWLTNANNEVVSGWRQNINRKGLAELLVSRVNCVTGLTEETFRKLVPVDWNPTDVFQQNFAPLFASYHRLREWNKVNRFYATQEGEERHWITDEEFYSQYGLPPWETVNRILEEANLPLRVNWPEGDFDVPFTLKLHNTELDCDVSYKDLSSGEKIIISLAHCLYYAGSNNPSLSLPKLLLLDEPDAPLHPSMTRSFMRVIEQVLVGENGVKVIMTTHSPTTVAFAPTGSVYKLERKPRRLVPCSKDSAITVLTDGFATVLETTRFVITEAMIDHTTYQSLFQAIQMSGAWPTLPNLVFVQASDSENRTGGGKGQVANWAGKLSELGLPFFRGLIDRDSGNADSPVIKVLGRYSLENYLLDPIILYACLVDKNRYQSVLKLDELRECNVHSITSFPAFRLQEIADAVCQKLESFRPELVSTEKFEVEYQNAHKISLLAWMRDTRGHDLAQIVCSCFRDGERSLISRKLEEPILMLTAKLPGFIPKDLVGLFVSLAS